MPSALSDRIPAEIRQRVRDRIQAALNAGRGVAVLPLRDLLPYPTDEDHLNGDPYEAQDVLGQVAFLCGYSGAVYVDLPYYADRPVVLVRHAYGTPQKVPDLIHALRDMQSARSDERDAAAEKLAAALRAITPRSVAAMRT